MNLLNVSMLDSNEMNNIIGSGVPCHPSNCKNDIHISVSNALENMKTNNPPGEERKDPI